MAMMMVGFTAYFGAFVGGTRPPGIDPALTSTRSYDPPETYANGCAAAVVEVDVETGVVTVEQLAIVDDCGVVLNPLVVDGQLAGAVAQGVGGALYEELVYDEDGNFLAGTLLDYLYPTTLEIPAIEVGHIETPSPVTEGGVKGCGEGGTICEPAAVVNAVADALSSARSDDRAHAARPRPGARADPRGAEELMGVAEAKLARTDRARPGGRGLVRGQCAGGPLVARETTSAAPSCSRAIPVHRRRVNVQVLEPGQPNCMYHGEGAQEDILVLSGDACSWSKARSGRLHAWDFVHCPPWTQHVFVGAGRDSVVLMIGRRPERESLCGGGRRAAARGRCRDRDRVAGRGLRPFRADGGEQVPRGRPARVR